MIQNHLIALTRTWVPIGVGGVLAWLAVHFGVTVDEKTQAGLVILVTALIQGIYYLVVKALEARWPQLGFLLGVPARPTYGEITVTRGRHEAGAANVVMILLIAIFAIVLILLVHGPVK